MTVISTVIEFNGQPVKIENGNIYLRSFGTTMNNHSMHWSWAKVDKDKLKPEIVKLLKEKGLI